VPRDPAPQQNGDPAMRVFDMQHLKDIPYNGSLPKPIFPSTDRVQRVFTVEYVYDYAYSQYKPEVPLSILSPLQIKRDTPEDALIALLSAMRSGDYDAFVKSFDAAGQAHLADIAKTKNQGPAYWLGIFKSFYGTKPMLLVDRIENNGYVILDTRFSTGDYTKPFPNIFKMVDGKWYATNDLMTNPIFLNIPPVNAGEIIRVQPTPVATLTGPGQFKQIQAQSDYLQYHSTRESVSHTGN
jgi:hypothetical protein